MNRLSNSIDRTQVFQSWKYPLLSWRNRYKYKLTGFLIDSAATDLQSSGSINHSWIAAVGENKWESKFFGKPSFRIDPFICSDPLNTANLSLGKNLLQTIKHSLPKSSHLAVSVDSADSASIQAICSSDFFLADSISCYLLDLANDFHSEPAHPSVRAANEKDIDPLFEISAICFGDRAYNINRFNSDSWYDQALVAKMYGLWLRNSIAGDLADYVSVFEIDNKPVGFATAKLASECELKHGIKLGKIVLNAVAPDQHRKGIYTAVVKDCLFWLKERGMEIAEIRTQVPNIGVHKAWQNMGASMVFTLQTFHWAEQS